MKYFYTDGANSDKVAIRLPNGVVTADFTNPSSPVYTALNWISAGYTNGQSLTGLDGGGQNSLPSLTVSITGPDPTIWQGGIAKNQYPLPFVIYSTAPTVPIFLFNAPHVAGVYHATVVFTNPNGQDTIVKEFDFTVILN
ncbi:hypothetical protein KGP36_01955 [Patescibacteria group bacterium]|nr:hypothetical protein [Patescibacteria group bacterium]